MYLPTIDDETDLPPGSAKALVGGATAALGVLGSVLLLGLVYSLPFGLGLLGALLPLVGVVMLLVVYLRVVSGMVDRRVDRRGLATALGLVTFVAHVVAWVAIIDLSDVDGDALPPVILVLGAVCILVAIIPLGSRELASWLRSRATQRPPAQSVQGDR